MKTVIQVICTLLPPFLIILFWLSPLVDKYHDDLPLQQMILPVLAMLVAGFIGAWVGRKVIRATR